MRVAETKKIVLNSSTVAESTETEYAGGTTYATGDVVKVSYDSDGVTARTPVIEYESLADSNTGNYPPDSPTQWSELGATNRWKMFDDYLNTATESSADIVIEAASNRTDMVGLFNLTAHAVVFELWRDGTLLSSETKSLRTLDGGAGWYSWLYGEYEYKTKAVWSYPKYTDAVLKVTIETAAGEASCGALHMGAQVSFGKMVYGAGVGINDYSFIEEDARGRLFLEQGNFADRSEIELWLQNEEVDMFRRKLAALRGKLSVFDLNNPESDYDAFRIYGYPKNFDIILSGPSVSKCNIEIGGAT